MEFIVDLDMIRSVLSQLAVKHWERFKQSGEREELDTLISYGHIVLGLCPKVNPNCHRLLMRLATSLFMRFQRWGETDDIQEAIGLFRISVDLCPKGHIHRTWSLNSLADSLAARFDRHEQTADLDEAVELYCTALELYPKGDPARSSCMYHLASSFLVRFQRRKQTADLDKAIELYCTALELYRKGDPARSSCMDNLASSFEARFDQHARVEDLNRAIELYCAILELHPKGHPKHSAFLSNLATSLGKRFALHGQIKDLDKAIELYHTALDLNPKDHAERILSLCNLAVSLNGRFEQYRRVEDLDKAIEFHRIALDLCPREYSTHSRILNGLGNSLKNRFKQHGRVEDLDNAIELHRVTLELHPGHPNRCTYLSSLASSLNTRFEQYEQMEDLNKAIELYYNALELRPKGHPNRFHPLNNLAASLWARFERDERVESLDTVIGLYREALELLPKDHPQRFMALTNLAGSLSIRSEQQRQTEDLDEAIKLHRTAVEVLPKGHLIRYRPLHNLASSLKIRFDQNGRMEDLDEAIELRHTILELCPEGHTSYSTSLRSLALLMYSQFKRFGLMEVFEECIQLLEYSAEHKFSSSADRLTSAVQWANLARSHGHRTTSRAYKVAMLLLQRALIVSPTLHGQLDFLNQKGQYKILALEAAAYAIEENRLEDAIEILEQGRGLLWSQMRGFRTSLEELTETNKELADRFRTVSHRLENLATSSTVSQSNLNATQNALPVLDADKEWKLFDEGLKLKRQLSDEQEEIINKIRLIPGFESFLAATPFKVLQQAASEGPVIVVNHCRYRSDALIILAREDLPVVCVPLDGEFCKDSIMTYIELLVTRRDSTAGSAKYDEVLRQSMKMLWDRVVSKIVSKFQDLGINEGSRIWWCPTSVLSALPFHAAGPLEDSDGTAKYLLDKYISSYTPTLGALIKARSGGNGGEPKVLVVGDTSLLSANREISNIRNCGISTKLLLKKVTCDAVIKVLRETTWVHFVCHGNLDPAPFCSSFKLSDRGLTLIDIVQAHLPNAEFAYLSACHTAEQPLITVHDESLHLAAAIQFSGFRSVIGSMWELLDVDGPFFARSVYEYMWDCDESEARHKRAATGLRKAAVELKAREGIRTERWVNLIHIGA